MFKKASVRFSMKCYTPIEFFMNLTIEDFIDIANEIQEVKGDG